MGSDRASAEYVRKYYLFQLRDLFVWRYGDRCWRWSCYSFGCGRRHRWRWSRGRSWRCWRRRRCWHRLRLCVFWSFSWGRRPRFRRKGWMKGTPQSRSGRRSRGGGFGRLCGVFLRTCWCRSRRGCCRLGARGSNAFYLTCEGLLSHLDPVILQLGFLHKVLHIAGPLTKGLSAVLGRTGVEQQTYWNGFSRSLRSL